tara:strand:- start:2241 stop:3209 length:969 start_codon:yes stop_codon:yes gene_type:complete
MTYFLLENTSSKQRAFNNRTDKLYSWLETIPWEEFGIDSSDGIEHQEILNLQNAVDADADGLVGLSTLQSIQHTLARDYDLLWNPISGETYPTDNGFALGTPSIIWNGLKVPLPNLKCELHTFLDPQGIDLHSTGSFSKKVRDINSVVVHWGGLNPQHLGRVFKNRKASSHFAIGIGETSGEVEILQYLDVAHVAWHAVGANQKSIGIDVCQQPELKHLGYYKKHGYEVKTIENPTYPKYGPKKIISLDPRIESATISLLEELQKAFDILPEVTSVEDGVLDKEILLSGGIFSHFNVDFKGQGKWDVAPWWERISRNLGFTV